MKTITATKARTEFANCLDSAETGEELYITRQGHEDIALISATHLTDLKSTSEMMKEIKVKLFDTIVSKSPDEVNALHDVLCVLTNAPRITNPDIISAIEAAEKGEGKEFSLPDLED